MRKKKHTAQRKGTLSQLRFKTKGMVKTVSNTPISKDTLDACCGKGAKALVCRLKAHSADLEMYTRKKETIILMSDGSSISGIGAVEPKVTLPLLEGTAAVLSELGGVQVVPLAVAASDTPDLVRIVRSLAPSCSGIVLFGVSSPRCFEVVTHGKRVSDVPVLDATIHGFAPVVLAGLINAHVIAKKNIQTSRIAILGAGAVALSIANILEQYGVGDVVVVDRDGILGPLRTNVEGVKKRIALETNREGRVGGALEAITGADAVVSVSASGPLTLEYIRMMAQRSIIFALREPVPEISFEDAVTAGAFVCASRDPQLPNYLSEMLVLPHLLRALTQIELGTVPETLSVLIGETLAQSVQKPSQKKILPTVFDKKHGKLLVNKLKERYGA